MIAYHSILTATYEQNSRFTVLSPFSLLERTVRFEQANAFLHIQQIHLNIRKHDFGKELTTRLYKNNRVCTARLARSHVRTSYSNPSCLTHIKSSGVLKTCSIGCQQKSISDQTQSYTRGSCCCVNKLVTFLTFGKQLHIITLLTSRSPKP